MDKTIRQDRVKYLKVIDQTKAKIELKYQVNSIRAEKFAVQAIEALESHGGDIYNSSEIESVINIVVKEWI